MLKAKKEKSLLTPIVGIVLCITIAYAYVENKELSTTVSTLKAELELNKQETRKYIDRSVQCQIDSIDTRIKLEQYQEYLDLPGEPNSPL